MGKFFTKIRHKNVNLPKMGKCFPTIVGQSHWSRHCYWLSCLTYGLSHRHKRDLVAWAPLNNDPSPPKLKHENILWSAVLQIFTMSRHRQGNKKLTRTIASGDFHLGTTWPPLLSRWKSQGVGIPVVWVIFAENLKVINAGKCSHRWHWQLAREPRFVLFWWWTGSTAMSGLKFMSSIKCFDLSPQVHIQQGAGSFWLQFISFDGEGVIHSPACFSIKTTSWAGAIRAKLICVVRDILWLWCNHNNVVQLLLRV